MQGRIVAHGGIVKLCDNKASSIPGVGQWARAAKWLSRNTLCVRARLHSPMPVLDCRGHAAEVWRRLVGEGSPCSILAVPRRVGPKTLRRNRNLKPEASRRR
jgi:hypothetical protein